MFTPKDRCDNWKLVVKRFPYSVTWIGQSTISRCKSEFKMLITRMCCTNYVLLWDWLSVLHTDSNPVLPRKALGFLKNLGYSDSLVQNSLTCPQTSSLTSFHGCVLIPALFLCSFASCTHKVLHTKVHGTISTVSHAQAARPDRGDRGQGGGHGQLPRNPGNLLLRPPVSALG